MLLYTDILVVDAFVCFPELAHVVSMPPTIEVALRIIGACLFARGVVGIYLTADSLDVFALAPVCRASRRVHNCVQQIESLRT